MFETKIHVLLIDDAQPLEILDKGDWIDLRANSDFVTSAPYIEDNKLKVDKIMVPLGVAMKLPDGYEAIVAARSSTYKTYGLLPSNCIGIIDNSYQGSNDQWFFSGLCIKGGVIHKGDRICQFRIQLSQKATFWQRIKWFLSSGKIKFIYEQSLSSSNRSGFGQGTGER